MAKTRKTPWFLLVAKQARNLRENLNAIDYSQISDDQLGVIEYESEVLRHYLDDLFAHIEIRRKIRKLEAIDGRTAEEVAAFRAKAAELRAKHRVG